MSKNNEMKEVICSSNESVLSSQNKSHDPLECDQNADQKHKKRSLHIIMKHLPSTNTMLLVLLCLLVLLHTLTNLLLETLPDGRVRSSAKNIDSANKNTNNERLAAPDYVGGTNYGSIKLYNTTNPHFVANNSNTTKSWCPGASCNNSPVCAPCNRRFLFIVATGRSGSTTLLRMFNALPNVRISGENNNELYVASQLESNLEGAKGHNLLDGNAIQGSWAHNEIPPQAMACPIQKVVETLDIAPREELLHMNSIGRAGGSRLADEERNKILGMKVIRIMNGEWTPLEAAEFFQRNFPCSRIIVNYRSDIDEQVRSRANLGWETAANKSRVVEEVNFLDQFAGHLGKDMAKSIDMKMWREDVSLLNDVIDWLGYDKHCHFESIIHENHDKYEEHDSDPRLLNEEKCGLLS